MPHILYHDSNLIVLEKPAELLSQPGRGADKYDSVLTRVLEQFPDARIVHRLDQATSGLMVLARGQGNTRALSHQFATRTVHKSYLALVQGLMPEEAGEINFPLIADWPNRPKQRIDPHAGKAALTRYTVLAQNLSSGQTRVALYPVTGRTHQLRVHLMALGFPIIGDRLYGQIDPKPEEGARLLLHACELGFTHPDNGQNLHFESLVPF